MAGVFEEWGGVVPFLLLTFVHVDRRPAQALTEAKTLEVRTVYL